MAAVCSPVCAGRAVLCIVLLSGLCSCVHHYVFIDEPKTWKEAQTYCRDYYTDLATVYNMEDMERLIAAAGRGYSRKAWIGLHDKPKRWYWILPDDGLYGEKSWITRWAHGQPDDVRNQWEICVNIRDGLWYDDSCSSQKPFVCYHRTDTSGLPNNSSVRYIFVDENKSWHDAHAYCKLNYTGLTSVRSEAESEAVQQVVPDGRNASIGLRKKTWKWWSDGTQHEFRHWLDRHPLGLTGDCAASVIDATKLGKWIEQDCNLKLPFMCQSNKKQQFYIKLRARGSAIDLNDPAVLEGIFNHIKKKMKEKGVETGFDISWIKKPDKDIFHKDDESADSVKTEL